MLEPNESFQNAILAGTLKMTELYDVELPTGFTFHYTTHSESILWGDPGVIYYAQPIERQQITNNINLEMDTVQISIQNITGELYELVNKNILDAAKITIKRISWVDSYAPDLETILFVGTADVEFDRKNLVLSCKSVLNSLNIQVPKQLYQEPCNHALFDINCGLTRANYKYEGTLTVNSADRLTITDNNLQVNLNGENPSDVTLFKLGEIVLTSGDNEGQRRMIRTASPSNIIAFTPFTNDILSDVTFEAYPGCDKRVAETCSDIFINQENFLGFIHVPKIQDTL